MEKEPEVRITFEEIAKAAHDIARKKGWWNVKNPNIPEKLALMHSEISEALEEHRNGRRVNETYYKNGKPEGMPIELADLLIRVFDFCGYYEIDIENAVIVKMAYNNTRPHRHGGKTC